MKCNRVVSTCTYSIQSTIGVSRLEEERRLEMSQQNNWASLKKKLTSHQPHTASSSSSHKRSNSDINSTTLHDEKNDNEKKKIKRTDINDTIRQQNEKEKEERSNEHKFSRIDKSKYVGLDCEMVGTGEDGKVRNHYLFFNLTCFCLISH